MPSIFGLVLPSSALDHERPEVLSLMMYQLLKGGGLQERGDRMFLQLVYTGVFYVVVFVVAQ